jgi:hypothetical protein
MYFSKLFMLGGAAPIMPMISQINSPSDNWGFGDTMIYTCSSTNDSQIPEVAKSTR